MSIKQSNITKLSIILLISSLILSSNLAAGELAITQGTQVSAQTDFPQMGKPDLQGLAGGSVNPESSALLESSIDAAIADGNDSIQLVIGIGGKSSDYAKISDIASRYGGKVDDTISMDNNCALVLTVPTKSASLAASAIEKSGLTRYVEPNIEYHINMEPNDPYWNGTTTQQWGPQKVQANYAWNTTIGSYSILVAVIDTGIDYNHTDLVANYVNGGRDWVNNDNDPKDDNGHGTHCAGIIAATLNNGIGVAGLAQVRIMAEKGLSASGSGGSIGLANAICHAVDSDANIISNSWGSSTESQYISDAIDYAVAHNVLVLVAAGNSGKEEKEYPASNPKVVSVGATNVSDTIASFSTYGTWVDVSAPGVMIYSTMPTYHVDMNNQPRFTMTYSYANGTSMACPMAAGVAALVWSQYPDMTANLVRYQLENTVDDLGVAGVDKYFGHGRVNAKTAVEQAPPSHDLVVMDWATPFDNLKTGVATEFTPAILNHALTEETSIEVRLLANDTVVDSTTITSLPLGQYAYPTLSWTPSTDGTYNITIYVVPVSGEALTENNVMPGTFSAITLADEWTWSPLDNVEYYGCDIAQVGTEANSEIAYFRVGFYTAWGNLTEDVDAVILVDTDRNQRTGLPDRYYPDQYSYLGADYAIVVGSDGYQVWKWNPTLNFFDVSNPIKLAYLDAPETSDEFVVGVYMDDLATDGSFDFNIVDAGQYAWDWVADYTYLPFIPAHNAHEVTVTVLMPKSIQVNSNFSFYILVSNFGLNVETVALQLIINGTVVTNELLEDLPPDYIAGVFYTLHATSTDLYNITAYAEPVEGETSVLNNVRSTLVSVGDKIALVADYNELAAIMTKLDVMYVGYDVYNFNYYYQCTEYPSFMQMYHTVIFYNDNREITETEQSTLNDYLAHGGNLLVTGWDSLGHPDDPLLADVIRSSTYGDSDAAQYDLQVVNSAHPIMNGSYGQFSAGYTINDLFGDTDKATADSHRGAVTIAALSDGYAKIIATESLPGTVVYWNGDGTYDWTTNADCLSMLGNTLHWFDSTTSPITTDDYDGNWHTSNFTINLSTDDYFGTPETYYRVNDGENKTVSIDGQPIIADEGADNTLEYWSVDAAGHEEAHHMLTDIKLDKAAPTAYAGPSQTVTVGQVVTFDGSGSSDINGLVNYSWNFGDGTYGSGIAPTHSYRSAGIYVAILTVEDPVGNTAWSGVTITVNSPSSSGSSQSSSSLTPTPKPIPTPTPTPTPAPSPNTISVTKENGAKINLLLSGNITSMQITNAILTVDQSAAKATLIFTITGENGTTGYGNLTIPKTSVPSGTTPQIFIDDKLCQNQGYTEDTDNFYVWWTTTFSKHQMTIIFTGPVSASENLLLWYVVGALLFAAAVIAVAVLAFKRRT